MSRRNAVVAEPNDAFGIPSNYLRKGNTCESNSDDLVRVSSVPDNVMSRKKMKSFFYDLSCAAVVLVWNHIRSVWYLPVVIETRGSFDPFSTSNIALLHIESQIQEDDFASNSKKGRKFPRSSKYPIGERSVRCFFFLSFPRVIVVGYLYRYVKQS